MYGKIDWESLAPAGAFVLGAVLATMGTIMVVRILASMFGAELRRERRKRREQDDSVEK